MKKKIYWSILAAIFMMSQMISIEASDDNVNFSFKIKTYYDNSYWKDGRYRQTTNVNNKWKVNLAYSSEGAGTYTTFWLDKRGYVFFWDMVSDADDVKQGTGAHYYPAYEKASKSTVYLAAENNNYNNNSYTVSGYWDEETN